MAPRLARASRGVKDESARNGMHDGRRLHDQYQKAHAKAKQTPLRRVLPPKVSPDTRPPPMYVTPESLPRSGDAPPRCDAGSRKPGEDGNFHGFLERARPSIPPTEEEEASGRGHRRKEEEAATVGIALVAIPLATEPTIRPAEEESATRSATACLPTPPDHSPPALEANSTSAGTEPAGGEPWEIQDFEADRTAFLQRVLRVSAAAGKGSQIIRMRLCPPELGPLRLEIRLQDGAMNAQLEVETPAARDLILENLPLLEERLRQQEVRLERFDVDLREHLPDWRPDRESQQSRSRQRRRRNIRAARTPVTTLPQATSRQSRPWAADASRIDVTV